MRTIYFDYNATTPLDPGVRAAMLPFLESEWGNPSSVHHVGRRARAILDSARDRVATVLGSKPSEVIFTSGGTESNNLAVFGAARRMRSRGRHLITTTIEHPAVLQACQYLERHEGFSVRYLPVDAEGRVSVASLAEALRPDTVLVSIMAANNETGARQPVAELGALCQTRGVLFHTDAVQWFGKEPWDSVRQFNADFVSLCAHKFHGPKGAGLLYIKSPCQPDPLLFGGGQENERRAGTENMAAIMGLTHAVEQFIRRPVFDPERLAPLSARLLALADSLPGVHVRGPRTGRLANTVAFTVAGCDSISLLAALDLEGVCASSGSACSAGSLEPSHVMTAMGVGTEEANALVRFSLGRGTTAEEVSVVEELLPRIVRQVRGGESAAHGM